MAKIAPSSIKYIIYANFEAEGAIEKPDVIGALFGQTEGLLGEDMEMRELQKQGKIGRIDVNLVMQNSKTLGEIEIPSALDKTETSLIAAALETIEKIGPSETKVIVEKIEDVRGSKRDFIMERAKQLMAKMSESEDVKDMGRELGEATKTAQLRTYGTENLPCGDLSGEEIIIVEGRADVVNMLKQGVKNVICMNGVKLPETIKELSKEKTSVLFVDGDRGGKLIIKNVMENADIDYIAIAPEGKEVEELTSKEILQSLRKRQTIKEHSESSPGTYSKSSKKTEKLTEEQKEKIKKHLEELIGTRGAILFDKDLNVIRKMPLSGLFNSRPFGNEYILAINDTAAPNIIKIAEEIGVSHLIAKNFTTTDTSLDLISL
jgi:DNA primase